MPRIIAAPKETRMTAKLETVKSPSVRDRVSGEEWQLRVDLAAAYQLAAQLRWTDLIYTHSRPAFPAPSTC